jgi:hypothetical protein
MINAKKELLEHVGDRAIKCAVVEAPDDMVRAVLPAFGKSIQNLVGFFDALDFEYNNGFGTQVLFGIIWYTDGAWSEREEYDGSEWWAHRECPKIPAACLQQEADTETVDEQVERKR